MLRKLVAFIWPPAPPTDLPGQILREIRQVNLRLDHQAQQLGELSRSLCQLAALLRDAERIGELTSKLKAAQEKLKAAVLSGK